MKILIYWKNSIVQDHPCKGLFLSRKSVLACINGSAHVPLWTFIDIGKDSKAIWRRWEEQFQELVNRNTTVDPSAIDELKQYPILKKMATEPTLDKVDAAISKMWNHQATGLDFMQKLSAFFNKGDNVYPNNYRGISLLPVVGKVIGLVILQRISSLAEAVLPESPVPRGTLYMILVLRQVQEKPR